MLEIYLYSALALFLYIAIAFIVGTVKKNNSLMDIFYGPAYIVLTWTALIVSGSFAWRQIVVTILITLWGIRLGTYVFIRNHGKGEDPRYKNMRERWGNRAILLALLSVYIYQGLVVYLVGFPAIYLNGASNPSLNWLDAIGIGLWVFGFFFETVGDYQLYKFLQDPTNKGHIMTRGLWKYTMHPNYFGEVTQWWAIWIIAISVPWGFLMIFSPLYITFQIVKVSGVKLLDKRYKDNPEYQEYREVTSKFFPWFPKKRKLSISTPKPEEEKLNNQNLKKS